MNINKIKVALVVSGVTLLAGISGYITYSQLFPHTETSKTVNEKVKEVDNTLKKNDAYTDKDIKDLSEEDKLNLAYGDKYSEMKNILHIGKESNKEYPKDKTDSFYNDLIKMAQSSDYNSIIEKVKETSKSYKFTEEYNWKIIKVYNDANIMEASLSAPPEGKAYMVKNLTDPNMLLISTLMLPVGYRGEIIQDVDSLSPSFKGMVDIYSSNIIDKNSDMYNQIASEVPSLKDVVEIKFGVEQNPLIAYVVTYADGGATLYSIKQDGDYTCYYKTVSYWNELKPLINK